MFGWGFDAGEGLYALWLTSAVGVALLSTTAWLISRRARAKAALRSVILFTALVSCLALPPVAWFCASTGLATFSIPLVQPKSGAVVAAVPTDVSSVAAPPRTTPGPVATHSDPLPTSGALDHNREIAPTTNDSPTTPAAVTTNGQGTHGLTPSMTLRGAATWAVFIWAAGVLLMLARLAVSLWRVARLRRSSRPAAGVRLQELLQECTARFQMRFDPLLLLSRSIISPLGIGVGRSAIILPERLLGALSDDELRDILMHEIAHLKRGDHWVVLLEELAWALYWPIVSVHALNRELQRAREEVCDNFVLALRDPILYGETLLRVANLLVISHPIGCTTGIIGKAGDLERRIEGLIDPRRNTATSTSGTSVFAVRFAFLAGLGLLAATRFAASAPPGDPAQPLAKPTKSAASSDPKRPGHFRGRVTNLDDKPVQGARLYVLAWSEEFDRETARIDTGALLTLAKTDGDGRFDFDAPDMVFTDVDGLPAQKKCLVIATADGYGPDWHRIADRASEWGEWHTSDVGGSLGIRALPAVDPIDLALQLAPDDAPIRGRLLDPDGRPLAGARVMLEELKIPVGQSLADYIEHVTTPESGRRGWMDFARFITEETPLPGMTAETQTDADGRFTLTGLGRERLATLKVTAASVVNTVFTVMTRNAPDIGTERYDGEPRAVTHGAEFTLQLKPGATISGVVRDRDTKHPIAGMWVGWCGAGGQAIEPRPVEGLRSGTYSRATDANGRFTISGIWPKAFNGPDAQAGSPDSWHDVMAISAPGMLYQTAAVNAKRDEEVVVECARGIPFRLKLVDEQGQPVVADVTHCDVSPSPYAQGPVIWRVYYEPWISRAAHRGGGIYEGFVLPGPGAVVASIPGRGGYRPAHVDPKAFFAPGRTDWTPQELNNSYGTQDTLTSSQHWHDQHDYVAIVLINPSPDSGPLELSATVYNDKPRQVTLVDPEGKPVVGAQTEGMARFFPVDDEPPLRSATFSLSGLNPDRTRRITFIEEPRKLIGVLLARSDGEAPYTVVMRPWGTVTGQIVDHDGKPDWAWLYLEPDNYRMETNTDPEQGQHARIKGSDFDGAEPNGRFRIDQLVPGQRYSVDMYRGIGKYVGMAFENLVLAPGEVRDLGVIRSLPPVDVRKK